MLGFLLLEKGVFGLEAGEVTRGLGRGFSEVLELGLQFVGLGVGPAGGDLLLEAADQRVLHDYLVLQVFDVPAVLLLLPPVLGGQLLILLLVVEFDEFVGLSVLFRHRLRGVLRVQELAGGVGTPFRPN